MSRRKKLIKLPFFKFKINRRTIFNIFGFLLVLAAIVLLLSFLKTFSTDENGKILAEINTLMINRFSGLAIFLPFIVLLISGLFFNTKKLKFIKPNIIVGLLLIFVSLLGIFKSGEYGNSILTNLSLDFSAFGAMAILIITFIIGLILFLDTSVDAFFLFLLDIIKTVIKFIPKFISNGNASKVKDLKKVENKQMEFIQDKKIIEKKSILPVGTAPAPLMQQLTGMMKSDLNIRPLSNSSKTSWVYPPLTLLADVAQKDADRGDVNYNAQVIENTLNSFGINAKVAEFNKGPSVTQYAIQIAQGTKLSKITALSNDLALALAATTGQVRIEAPIPGRSLVGIEIPNIKPQIVTLKHLLASSAFANITDPLLVPLGLDVAGQPALYSITKMPHVLIAGTTGSGKSVMLNAWICTFLFRAKPEELRMIMVDPKRVELTPYNGIPHLLTEVIVDPDKILSALKYTVGEMENRYKDFAKYGVRNLESYNMLEGIEKKPYIMFIIDELADLMIFAPGESEELITRIAQKARATGIHLILATQRPSVDVITGLMKANIPARVAFSVSSMIDSRVIIDMPGAEKLLGKGDMLFLPPDQAKPRRIQGPFITEKEVNQLVKFLKSQNPEVHYTEEITQQEVAINNGRGGIMATSGEGEDPLFKQSLDIIMQFDKASSSLLQRKLSIGYNRAARILDQLHEAGYIGPAEGSKPREVIKRPIEQQTTLSENI